MSYRKKLYVLYSVLGDVHPIIYRSKNSVKKYIQKQQKYRYNEFYDEKQAEQFIKALKSEKDKHFSQIEKTQQQLKKQAENLIAKKQRQQAENLMRLQQQIRRKREQAILLQIQNSKKQRQKILDQLFEENMAKMKTLEQSRKILQDAQHTMIAEMEINEYAKDNQNMKSNLDQKYQKQSYQAQKQEKQKVDEVLQQDIITVLDLRQLKQKQSQPIMIKVTAKQLQQQNQSKQDTEKLIQQDQTIGQNRQVFSQQKEKGEDSKYTQNQQEWKPKYPEITKQYQKAKKIQEVENNSSLSSDSSSSYPSSSSSSSSSSSQSQLDSQINKQQQKQPKQQNLNSIQYNKQKKDDNKDQNQKQLPKNQIIMDQQDYLKEIKDPAQINQIKNSVNQASSSEQNQNTSEQILKQKDGQKPKVVYRIKLQTVQIETSMEKNNVQLFESNKDDAIKQSSVEKGHQANEISQNIVSNQSILLNQDNSQPSKLENSQLKPSNSFQMPSINFPIPSPSYQDTKQARRQQIVSESQSQKQQPTINKMDADNNKNGQSQNIIQDKQKIIGQVNAASQQLKQLLGQYQGFQGQFIKINYQYQPSSSTNQKRNVATDQNSQPTPQIENSKRQQQIQQYITSNKIAPPDEVRKWQEQVKKIQQQQKEALEIKYNVISSKNNLQLQKLNLQHVEAQVKIQNIQQKNEDSIPQKVDKAQIIQKQEQKRTQQQEIQQKQLKNDLIYKDQKLQQNKEQPRGNQIEQKENIALEPQHLQPLIVSLLEEPQIGVKQFVNQHKISSRWYKPSQIKFNPQQQSSKPDHYYIEVQAERKQNPGFTIGHYRVYSQQPNREGNGNTSMVYSRSFGMGVTHNSQSILRALSATLTDILLTQHHLTNNPISKITKMSLGPPIKIFIASKVQEEMESKKKNGNNLQNLISKKLLQKSRDSLDENIVEAAKIVEGILNKGYQVF